MSLNTFIHLQNFTHCPIDDWPGIVSRPVLVQELENFDEQVTYCFKGMWQELRSYEDGIGDRRTRKHRLSPVLLAQALCKQDEIGFTGLTFTAGVRKRRK